MRMNPAPRQAGEQGQAQQDHGRTLRSDEHVVRLLPPQDLHQGQHQQEERSGCTKIKMTRSGSCSTPGLSPSTEMDLLEITSDEVGGTPYGSVGVGISVGGQVEEEVITRRSARDEEDVIGAKAIPVGRAVRERENEEKTPGVGGEPGSMSLLTVMMQEQRKKDIDRQQQSRPGSSSGMGERSDLQAGNVGSRESVLGLQGALDQSLGCSALGINTPRPILVCPSGPSASTTMTCPSMASSLARRTSPSMSPSKKLAGCSILRKPSEKWYPSESGGSVAAPGSAIQVDRSPSPKAIQAAPHAIEEAAMPQTPAGPRKTSLTFAVVPPAAATEGGLLQRKVSDGKKGSTSVTFKALSDDPGHNGRRVLADEVIMEDDDEEEEEGKDEDEAVEEDEDEDEDNEDSHHSDDMDGGEDDEADQPALTSERSRGRLDSLEEQHDGDTAKHGSYDRQSEVSDEYDDEEEDEDEDLSNNPRQDSYDANLSEQPTPMSEVVDSMSETDGDEEEEDDDDNGEDDLELNVNGTASGYEEDSEAGFSSDDSAVQRKAIRSGLIKTLGRSPRPTKFRSRETQVVKEEDDEKSTRFVSPRGRRGLYHVRRGKLVMEERDVSHASPRERRLSSQTQQLVVDVEDMSEAPADFRRHHRYAFARPTNYRRRRPISEVHEEIIGGSASSLISPGSFVRIGGQEGRAEVERGRGAVQIQHALPPRPHNAVAAGKSGNDSCTRHRSPPPRARTKLAQLGRSASERSNWNVPPAGQSPSAGRLKIKRGVSDSPRKRRAKEVGYGTDVLALGQRSRRADNDSIVEEDPSAMSAALTGTENETTTGPHPGPSALAKLSALRGWRSDDAVFAVPTVKREPPIKPRLDARQAHQPQPPRRRPGPPPSPLRPTRTMTSASSSRNESACESDQTGFSGTIGTGGGHRSASERMVNGMISVLRRASGTVQPFFKTDGRDLSSPMSPDANINFGSVSFGLDTASLPRPCEVAIDMTPALGIKAGPAPGRSSAPAQQVLHQTLNSRASSPWSPLMSSDEHGTNGEPSTAPPVVELRHAHGQATPTSGYMTEPTKVSLVDPGRRGSQPEVRVTSRPIQCPLRKRAALIE